MKKASDWKFVFGETVTDDVRAAESLGLACFAANVGAIFMAMIQVLLKTGTLYQYLPNKSACCGQRNSGWLIGFGVRKLTLYTFREMRFSLLIAFDKVKAKNQQDRLSDQSSSQ